MGCFMIALFSLRNLPVLFSRSPGRQPETRPLLWCLTPITDNSFRDICQIPVFLQIILAQIIRLSTVKSTSPCLAGWISLLFGMLPDSSCWLLSADASLSSHLFCNYCKDKKIRDLGDHSRRPATRLS